MTIKTADRLAELRKSRGLSQEELAEKLGVTRQAVSKWERAESAPDTDNLIELAKIYGVSIDELINGEKIPNEQTNVPADESAEIKNDQPDDAKKEERNGKAALIGSLSAIIATVAYLLLGFILPGGKGWACYWFLFILIPVAVSIGDVAVKRKATLFNYPCLVTAIFCAVGMLAGIWHPTWVVFITIPVFYIIANAFEKSDGNEK